MLPKVKKRYNMCYWKTCRAFQEMKERSDFWKSTGIGGSKSWVWFRFSIKYYVVMLLERIMGGLNKILKELKGRSIVKASDMIQHFLLQDLFGNVLISGQLWPDEEPPSDPPPSPAPPWATQLRPSNRSNSTSDNPRWPQYPIQASKGSSTESGQVSSQHGPRSPNGQAVQEGGQGPPAPRNPQNVLRSGQ